MSASAVSASDLILIDADPVWREAVAVALEPWGTDVGELDDVERAADASASARGSRLARRSGGAVLVWLEPTGSGCVLWTYYATSRSAVGHELTASPPFDAPTAAAVALSLKTILRHWAVDGGARPPPPPEAPETRPQRQARPAAGRVPPSAPSWTLDLAGGARLFATEPADAELRVSLSSTYWPDALANHLGVGLRATSGPGIELRTSSFEGRWIETNAEVVLTARVRPIELVELGAVLGVGVGVTSVSGTLRPDQRDVVVWRANPGLSVQLALGIRPLPILGLGLRVGADTGFLTQRYLVRGEPVLEVRGVALCAMFGLEMGLDG